MASADAAAHTGGIWWSALTYLPLVGDDATGVRALGQSLDTIARLGVRPLTDTVDRLDGVTSGGRIDVGVVRKLAAPVQNASHAFAEADDDLSGLDSSGYAGVLKTRFDRYARLVAGTADALAAAETATTVLPTMIGADGPRDYLMIFQNNAEIRATGGMPGSWARVHADNGKLTLAQQGTAGDFRGRCCRPRCSRSRQPRRRSTTGSSGPTSRMPGSPPTSPEPPSSGPRAGTRPSPRSSWTACWRWTRSRCPTSWRAPGRSRWGPRP